LPSARNATAEGTTKKEIFCNPELRRERNVAAISESVPTAEDMAGNSAAETDIPKSETGSM